MSIQPFRIAFLSLVTFVCAASLACASHPDKDDDADQLTLGKVQSQISVGMDGAAVAQALGSPNIVSTDEAGREVWIYDKISTETDSSQSGVGGSIIIFGGSSSRASSSKTQKTLTVVIKFDDQKKVRDVAYNYSQF